MCLVNRVLSIHPLHERTRERRSRVEELIRSLTETASSIRPLRKFPPQQQAAWERDRAQEGEALPPLPPRGDPSKWKMWTPKAVASQPITSQKALEEQLHTQWSDSFLNLFEREANQFDFLRDLMALPDHRLEWRDLLGGCRWGSLRTHTRNFSTVLKHCPEVIPWSFQSGITLMNALERAKRHPRCLCA